MKKKIKITECNEYLTVKEQLKFIATLSILILPISFFFISIIDYIVGANQLRQLIIKLIICLVSGYGSLLIYRDLIMNY